MNGEAGFTVFVLNSGSSSLKFGLYRVQTGRIDAVATGQAESIGETESTFEAQDAHGRSLLSGNFFIADWQSAIDRIGRLLDNLNLPVPDAIGHRIVHGGPVLSQHCIIDDQIIQELEGSIPFAPLHNPSALAVIRFAQKRFPDCPHVACFDTAFHADMPEIARRLPIPKSFEQEGIHRYGFHGLSLESIMYQLVGDVPSRLVIAHLGNGASVTAVKEGKSIDTSMGLTPAGGIMMGTRSGDLDPGILIYLLQEKKLTPAMLDDLVNHRSGLVGVSGTASDMRRLHAVEASNTEARLAIDMFCYSASKQIAAMASVLGRIDGLVFTGGIGENDSAVRALICGGLSCLGIELDGLRNTASETRIDTFQSRCAVHVIASQEDEQIARHTSALVQCAALRP